MSLRYNWVLLFPVQFKALFCVMEILSDPIIITARIIMMNFGLRTNSRGKKGFDRGVMIFLAFQLAVLNWSRTTMYVIISPMAAVEVLLSKVNAPIGFRASCSPRRLSRTFRLYFWSSGRESWLSLILQSWRLLLAFLISWDNAVPLTNRKENLAVIMIWRITIIARNRR